MISVAARDNIKTTLSQPDRSALRTLFQQIISERLSAEEYDCHLLSLLERNSHTLEWWEERCAGYIAVIESLDDAIAKVTAELTGPAGLNPPREFNGRLGDLFTEISVVYELSKRRCSKFVPLVPPTAKKEKTVSAADYRCMIDLADVGQQKDIREAYLEVKNLRAPRGITDVFHDLYWELSSTYPELLKYRIALAYYCDNTVTDEQSSCIEDFLRSLGKCPLPRQTTLSLPRGVEVNINIIKSTSGGVNLIRPVGGSHSYGPFTDSEAFLKKATSTIEKAVQQLRQYKDSIRMLALNIQTPDAMFHNDIGIELQRLVKQKSEGTVECLLFHHHYFLEA